MQIKNWECAYDGSTKKLADGRCAMCGRKTEAESKCDAKAWDAKAVHVKSPHTPTPWIDDDENATHELMILGPNLEPIAVIETPDPRAKANAAFIVRAVNNFQQMREALMSYAFCSDGCTCGDGWDHKLAQQAIAKAEGK